MWEWIQLVGFVSWLLKVQWHFNCLMITDYCYCHYNYSSSSSSLSFWNPYFLASTLFSASSHHQTDRLNSHPPPQFSIRYPSLIYSVKLHMHLIILISVFLSFRILPSPGWFSVQHYTPHLKPFIGIHGCKTVPLSVSKGSSSSTSNSRHYFITCTPFCTNHISQN